MPTFDPFVADASDFTPAAVRAFVDEAIASRVQIESTVLELKRSQAGTNVVDAVAALSNTDGGLIIVGVDESEVEHRWLGLTRKDIDAIVQKLHALIPGAMPEVIPVALVDDSERALLVLRVDADAVDRPVILNGRVVVRIPGHTTGATRLQIQALLAESTNRDSWAGMPAVDLRGRDMWNPPAPVATEVRAYAGVLLPRSVTGTRYFGTDAVRAAESFLDESPFPRHLLAEFLRPWELGETCWRITSSGSNQVRLRTDLIARKAYRPPLEATAQVFRAGRQLEVVTAVALHAEEENLSFDVAGLRELLLSVVGAATGISRAVAGALGPMVGLREPSVGAWLGGTPGLPALRIDEWKYSRAVLPEQRTDWTFEELRLEDIGIAAIDSTVMTWLTTFLFDMGCLGFEPALESLELPTWARKLAHHELERRSADVAVVDAPKMGQ